MISEKDLYQRLVTLESEKLTLSADIAQLKKDAKYDEDDNPKGLPSDEIKNIHGAAKLRAKDDFLEKKEAADALFRKYRELTEDNGV